MADSFLMSFFIFFLINYQNPFGAKREYITLFPLNLKYTVNENKTQKRDTNPNKKQNYSFMQSKISSFFKPSVSIAPKSPVFDGDGDELTTWEKKPHPIFNTYSRRAPNPDGYALCCD
jgi:hypothetical protein